MLVYNANLRSISAGDTYPARYLPFAIVQYHTIYLDPIAKVAAQGRGDGAFWMLHRPDGHIISLYPVTLPLLVAPLYLPAVGYLHLRGWTDQRLDHVARVMEKFSASFLAALSASLLYLLLRRRAKAADRVDGAAATKASRQLCHESEMRERRSAERVVDHPHYGRHPHR